MVTKTRPDILAKNQGQGQQRQRTHSGGLARFSGHRKKYNYANTVKSYTYNTDPLKATRTRSTVAFKGSVVSEATRISKSLEKTGFMQDLVKSFKESEEKKAGKLIAEVRHYLPKEMNPGFDTVAHFFETNGKGVLKSNTKNLLEGNVKLSEKVTTGFANAFMAPFNAISNFFKGFSKGDEFKNKIKDAKTLAKKEKQLHGYWNEVTNTGKLHEKIHSGENLNKIKSILKKGDSAKNELKDFYKSKKIDTRQLFKGKDDWFKELSDNLLNKSAKSEEKFLNTKGQRYVSNVIKDVEDNKAGSPSAKFGSNQARFINKAVSGTTTAVFIAQDFYNLHIMAKNDPKGAKKERNKRFTQQMSYVGLTAYFDYVSSSMFKKMSNKYLGFAVGLGVLTSLAANTTSRILNGVPLLPTKPKGYEKKPYVIKASPLRKPGFESSSQTQDKQNSGYAGFKAYNRLKNSPATSNSLSFKGAAPKKAFSLIKLLPETINIKKFAESHEILSKIDPERADKLINLAAKHMRHIEGFPKKGENVTIDHIRKAAEKNNRDVIVGKNAACRMAENFGKALIYPFKLLKDIGVGIVNLARKAMGKDKLPKKNEDRFIHAQAAKNFINWAQESKEKVHKGKKMSEASPETINKMRLIFGEKTAGSHNPNNMEYGADELSTFMKLTGFISVPFLAMDAYNVTARETKNDNISREKAKQRAVQDSTRQAISFWAVKSFNDVFKDLANHSPAGAAASVLVNNAGYEAATRLVVGQPILPKTHKQMKEIEKRRLKNPSWLSKFLIKQRVRSKEDEVVLGSKKLLRDNDAPYTPQVLTSFSSDFAGFKDNVGIAKGFLNS